MAIRPYLLSDGKSSVSGVKTVNGQDGDVVVTPSMIGAQPSSNILTEISSISMPNNSFLMVDNTGEFTPATCNPVGIAWLGYTTVDQQKEHLAYSDIASSGSYNDLLDKPTSFQPSAHTHTISDVVGLQTGLDNKINVGSSIPYATLTGTPTIPTNTNQLTNGSGFITAAQAPVQSVNGQTGVVTLTIPAAQIQSDWNQANTASLDYIKNKPTIPTVNYPVTSVNTKTGAVVLTNTDVGAAATVHTHAISDVTGLQASLDSKATSASLSGYVTSSSLTTSLSGYVTAGSLSTTLTGYITNSSLTATLGGYATTTALNSGLITKFNVPSGTTAQYIRGDGSLSTFPSIPVVPTAVSAFTNDVGYLTTATLNGYRKVETFLGTTDASGNFTITFANTYSTPPDVQPQIIGGTFNQSVRVVSVTNTGCVVQAAQRNLVTLLSVEVLLGATVNLVGASVTVQVTPRN
jgi:hypothetical protein